MTWCGAEVSESIQDRMRFEAARCDEDRNADAAALLREGADKIDQLAAGMITRPRRQPVEAMPLEPSAELLEKLAGIVHTALHELPGSATDRLCRDPAVIDWTQRMMAIGLCPEPSAPSGSGR